MNKFIFFVFGIILCINSCTPTPESGKQPSNGDIFSFVFITDAHLEFKGVSVKYFNQAIDTINQLKPDFVISGGDLVRDANNVRGSYADSLYNLYLSESRKFNLSVYSDIGNHEITGLGIKSDVKPGNHLYGKKIFDEKVGKRYYSFNHNGWNFFILDNVKTLENEHRVIGHFDDVQMEWLKTELARTDSLTPIVICCHIPIITTIKKFQFGSLSGTPDFSAVDNSIEFFDLFKHKIQGHEHFLEVLYAMEMYFVTGSSVSGHGWMKPPDSRGMVLFNISGEDISWKFIANI